MGSVVRACCAAMLVAVLALDLAYDLRAVLAPTRDADAVERTLATITAHYRRITVHGWALRSGVALAMFVLVASVVLRGLVGPWSMPGSALESALVLLPIALALSRTFPSARRLARGDEEPAARLRRARAIALDHALCLPSVLAYLALQLA